MSRERIWLVGLGAAIVLVLLGGWFIIVSPIVNQVSLANDQRSSIQASNASSEARIAVLKNQFAHIDTLQKTLASLSESIPATGDSAVFLREIDSLTTADQVKLQSVTVSTATSYVPKVAASAPAASSSGSGSTPTASPSPSASSSATAAGGSTAVVAITPSSRLVLIPTQIAVNGPYDNVMRFIGGVQSGSRLYLAGTANIVLDASTGTFTGTLNGWVYALPTLTAVGSSPSSIAVAGEKTPVAPSAAPTASPTPTPSGSPTTKP